MIRVLEEMGTKVQEKSKEQNKAAGKPDTAETGQTGRLGSQTSGKQSDLLKNGILPSEGMEVFNRVLAGILPQVVVSTTDLLPRIEKSRIPPAVQEDNDAPDLVASSVTAAPRPEISSVYVAPKTDIERKIAENWQALLGIDKIGIHDDFFELGGDSLNVVQLNNQLKKTFDKDIPVAVMFQYQTVHTFAQYLKAGEENTGSAQEEDRSKELAKGKNRLKARMKRR